MTLNYYRLGSLFIVLSILAGCQTGPDIDFEPVSFTDLPGWHRDQTLKALPAMKRSCEVLAARKGCKAMITRENGDGKTCDWYRFCQGIAMRKFNSDAALRNYIESHLQLQLS